MAAAIQWATVINIVLIRLYDHENIGSSARLVYIKYIWSAAAEGWMGGHSD